MFDTYFINERLADLKKINKKNQQNSKSKSKSKNKNKKLDTSEVK